MQASTLRETAATVGETVTELVHEAGEVAQKLAAKTPWVEAPRPARRMPIWIVLLAAVGAVAIIGWLLAARRKPTAYVGDERTEQSREPGRPFAAAGT